MVMPNDCEGVDTEAQPVTCAVLEGGPCSACKERETIRQNIIQLEAEITKLKAKYDSLASTINAIHDPFIHKLPPEIGSYIFRLSLPRMVYGEVLFFVAAKERVAGSLRLGAVCRKWRQLAWATPDLWHSVYVSIHSTTSRSLANLLPDLLGDWLGRSGALPLTIVFNEGLPDEDVFEDELSDDGSQATLDMLEAATWLVIGILNLHSARWRNLLIDASTPKFQHFSGPIQPKQLFHLELVDATGLGPPSPPPEFKLESKFSPTHLKLYNFPLTSINIGWENITFAEIACMTDNEGLDILRQAPKLDHYDVVMHQPPPSTNPESPILHPRLRSLRLESPHLSDFLEVINLPSLEEWTQTIFGRAIPVAPMLSFLQRSRCSLKVLKLMNAPPPSGDFTTLLQAIPSLEYLKIEFRSQFEATVILDNVLTPIFYSAPESSAISGEGAISGCLLPHLQVLQVSPLPPSLWDHIPQLYHEGHRPSLAFTSCSYKRLDITNETALRLMQLIDEGVELKIYGAGGKFLRKQE